MNLLPSLRPLSQRLCCGALAALLVFGVVASVSRGQDRPARSDLEKEHARLVREFDRLKLSIDDVPTAVAAAAVLKKQSEVERSLFGPRSQELVKTLDLRSDLLEYYAQYADAVPSRRELLDIKKATLGDSNPETVTARHAFADADRAARRQVKFQVELALAVREGRSIRRLADAGKVKAAAEAARRQAAVIEKILGEDSATYLTAATNLADYLSESGSAEEALELLPGLGKTASSLWDDRHPDHGSFRFTTGNIYTRAGLYRVAMEELSRAKRIFAAAALTTDPRYAAAATTLGSVYTSAGLPHRAKEELRAAVEVLSKAGSEDRLNYVRALTNQASVLGQLGEFEAALRAHELAVNELKQSSPQDRKLRGITRSNMASLYVEMEDFERARDLYREAEGDLAATDPVSHARVVMLKGILLTRVASRSGKKADVDASVDAIKASQAAYELLSPTLGGRSSREPLARCHLHLGNAYLAGGRSKEAEAEFKEAVDALKVALGDRHPAVADACQGLALTYLRTGRPADALREFEAGSAIYKAAFSDRDRSYLGLFGGTVMALRFLDRRSDAVARQREIVDKMLAVRDGSFSIIGKQQRLTYLATRQVYLNHFLSLVPEGTSAADVYPLVVRSKGYLTAREEVERTSRNHPEAPALLDQFVALCAEMKGVSAGALLKAPEERANRLRTLEGQKADLEVQLANIAPAIKWQDQDLLKSLSERLPPNAALIDYVVYAHSFPELGADGKFKAEARLLAFVVRPGRAPVWKSLGPLEPIDSAVKRWRMSVEDGIDPESGVVLKQLLLDPINPELEGVNALVVCPDGPVCGVPFAALPGRRPERMLIDDLAVGYTVSPRMLIDRDAKSTRPPADGALLVGAMDYGELPQWKEGKGFLNLPHSPGTMGRLVAGFQRSGPSGSVKVLDREYATVAAFRKEIEVRRGAAPFKYIHLETHGFWNSSPGASDRVTGRTTSSLLPDLRSPEFRTGLAFHHANRSPDGVLSGEELAAVDLGGVDLAVLAACQSGLGDQFASEGALSLQRSFLASGVRSLVSSLWEVPLEHTRRLQHDFYDELWKTGGERKLAALRAAQLRVRDGAGGGRRLPPLYWAGWVLTGDLGPTDGVQPHPEERPPGAQQLVEEPAEGGPGHRILWWIVGMGAAGCCVLLLLVARTLKPKGVSGTPPVR